MLDALAAETSMPVERRRITVRRLRRAWSWLLLTGWIVLPLMPVLAVGFSKLLGVGF